MDKKLNVIVVPLLVVGAVLWGAVPLRSASAQDKPKETGAGACFARLKKLAGDWVQKDPKTGKVHGMLNYRVISGGSAVEETILPGTPESMTSIYHMDNGSLVMTHYCSIGNQPHLKATSASTPARMEFVCIGGGGNMKSENDMHIHHVLFDFPSENRFSADWSATMNGKPAGPDEKFTVTRKLK